MLKLLSIAPTCVASTTLHLPPLQDWHPVLLRAHGDLFEWACDILQCLGGDLSDTEIQRVRSVFFFLDQQMISVLSRHAPRQRRYSRHRQPSWWTPHSLALPAMVPVGTFAKPVLLSPSLVSGKFGWHFIGPCAVPIRNSRKCVVSVPFQSSCRRFDRAPNCFHTWVSC